MLSEMHSATVSPSKGAKRLVKKNTSKQGSEQRQDETALIQLSLIQDS